MPRHPTLFRSCCRAVLLASLFGSQPATSAEARATDTGWHCERNAAGDWTCVENEVIAPAPGPPPAAPVQTPSSAATTTDTTRLEALVEQRSDAGARRQAAARAAAQQLAEERAQAEQARAAQAAAAPTPPRPQQASGGGPATNERIGIMDLPDEYFTVQLLALSSRAALESFAREHQLYDLSAARIASGGELRYVLLMGAYPDTETARNAAALLPEFLRDMGPWIRTIGSLKSAMRAGDVLAAEDPG